MSSPIRIELTKSVLGQIEGLLKWAFILNGTAAAGLLTFVGNTVDKKPQFASWSAFGTALIGFAIGLILVVVTKFAVLLAFNYFAQLEDPEDSTDPEKIRIYLMVGDRGAYAAIAALILYFGSCVSFIVGILYGRYALFG